ncbi:MAG: hypothetical protein LQ352_004405, partial [Teloschistes flavicans]
MDQNRHPERRPKGQIQRRRLLFRRPVQKVGGHKSVPLPIHRRTTHRFIAHDNPPLLHHSRSRRGTHPRVLLRPHDLPLPHPICILHHPPDLRTRYTRPQPRPRHARIGRKPSDHSPMRHNTPQPHPRPRGPSPMPPKIAPPCRRPRPRDRPQRQPAQQRRGTARIEPAAEGAVDEERHAEDAREAEGEGYAAGEAVDAGVLLAQARDELQDCEEAGGEDGGEVDGEGGA